MRGKLFHSKGRQTLNLQSSNLEKVQGTERRSASNQRTERKGTSLQIKSSWYEGETLFTTLNTCNKILNTRPKRTGN